MRVLAAVDKFRGTVTAAQVASAIGAACWELGHECVERPVADGGEGTLEALGGANRKSTVTDPLGRSVEVEWRSSRGTAIIEMANAPGKIVVAEGVETLQQAQFLRRYNCARAQGFVFSAALPPELIPDFVREREREAAAIPLLPDLKLPSASRVLGPA